MISKKIGWTLFVVLLLVIAFCIYALNYSTGEKTFPATALPVLKTEEKSLPKPTGNVDDLTKDLLNGSASEQEMISREDSDKALIDEDSKVINEFGQSYNENEL